MCKIRCCYKCDKRHKNCHSHCEDYLTERKALDEYNAKQRQIKLNNQIFNDIKSDAIFKTKKRYNK